MEEKRPTSYAKDHHPAPAPNPGPFGTDHALCNRPEDRWHQTRPAGGLPALQQSPPRACNSPAYSAPAAWRPQERPNVIAVPWEVATTG